MRSAVEMLQAFDATREPLATSKRAHSALFPAEAENDASISPFFLIKSEHLFGFERKNGGVDMETARLRGGGMERVRSDAVLGVSKGGQQPPLACSFFQAPPGFFLHVQKEMGWILSHCDA